MKYKHTVSKLPLSTSIRAYQYYKILTSHSTENHEAKFKFKEVGTALRRNLGLQQDNLPDNQTRDITTSQP